ncbi:MAG: glycosyltransferase family 9 protein [Candidatus Acidiferrales bacterium]
MPRSDSSSRLAEAAGILPGLPHGAEVLLIRFRSLGDLVLETPAIRALHDWRPDLSIVILAEARFAAVFEHNPALSEVIFPHGLLGTSLELRRRAFPVAFNQHGGPRSAMITGLSGARWRVGWKGYQYSFFYNVQVPDARDFFDGAAVHTAAHRLSQLYFAGLPRGPIPKPQIFPQPDATVSVARALAAKGIGADAPYAVLQPGARLPGMRWPIAQFAKLAGWLRDKHGLASVVNLAARDEELAAVAATEFQGVAVIPPPLSVRELIALIAKAHIFVGNDSGPAHLASALDRPNVVIFSETDPAQWAPLNSRGRVVSTGATFRYPRGDKSVIATQPRALDAIALEEVQQACNAALQL